MRGCSCNKPCNASLTWHDILPHDCAELSTDTSLLPCPCRDLSVIEATYHKQAQQRPDPALLSSPSIASDDRGLKKMQSNLILGVDKGVWVAAGLIVAWATMIHVTVFHTPLHSLQAVALFFPMMQLHTG